MEADCLWFKRDGVVVLEGVTFGYSFFGRPSDYVYDSAVIDYKKRMMWVRDGSNVYPWVSESNLVVPDIFIMHFTENQLARKSSTSMYEMIHLLRDFFQGYCDSSIAIMEIQRHREAILTPLKNYIPASIIQRTWRRCVSDPNYVVCRSRLRKEFAEL